MKNNAVIFAVILIALIIVMPVSVIAQAHAAGDPSIKKGNDLIYKALVSYDVAPMFGARKEFEDVLKKDSLNAPALYGITFLEYKLLEMSMQKGGMELFDKYYQSAIDYASRLTSQKEYSSEGNSLLAAIYMMKIASSPMTAVALVPKIYGLLGEAEKEKPDNPETYVILGQMKFNTPAMFGGSFKDAVKSFSKAEALFEKGADSQMVNIKWGRLESLAWLGRSFEKMNNQDAAKFAYQKAIVLEPEFGWVKYQLLPALEKSSDTTESN
ncbi:MAG: hypothetical protein ACYDEE_01670 [Ignavibacteriaceae bacterium]